MGRSAISCCALQACGTRGPGDLPGTSNCFIEVAPRDSRAAAQSEAVSEFCAFARDRYQGRLADALTELGVGDASPVTREDFLRHAVGLGFPGDPGRVFDALDAGGLGVLSLGELRLQLLSAAGVGPGGDKPSTRRKKGPSPRKRIPSPERKGRGKRLSWEGEGTAFSEAAPEDAADAGGGGIAASASREAAASAGVAPPSRDERGGAHAAEELDKKSRVRQAPAAEAAAGVAPSSSELRIASAPSLEAPEDSEGGGGTLAAAAHSTPASASSSPIAAPPRRSSLASVGSAWEAQLPRMGPTRVSGGRAEPPVVVGPVAGPEDEDGDPMVDTSELVTMRPLPYIPVLPEEEDSTKPRTFVHHGRLIVVPLLPINQLSKGKEEVKLPRGSNWAVVKSKVMGGAGGTVSEPQKAAYKH